MFDIIGIGESDIDIYLEVAKPPGRGEKARAKEIGKLPGGMIGNFCSGAVKHGMKCGIVSVLGDDENGRIALADYQTRGIDTRGLKIVKDGQTFYCVVCIDGTGEKYLTAVVTDLISPALEDIDIEYITQAKYVHLNSMDYRLAAHVAQMLANTNTKLSLDYEAHADNAGFEPWLPILENVSILFINEDGMQNMFPDTPMDKAAAAILSAGVEMVVVTLAEKGGVIYQNNSQYSYKAFAAKIIKDTTGAGDCFNAAFLSSIIKGMEIEAAAEYAAAAAALSIGYVGARTGLPTQGQVQAFLETQPEFLS